MKTPTLKKVLLKLRSVGTFWIAELTLEHLEAIRTEHRQSPEGDLRRSRGFRSQRARSGEKRDSCLGWKGNLGDARTPALLLMGSAELYCRRRASIGRSGKYCAVAS